MSPRKLSASRKLVLSAMLGTYMLNPFLKGVSDAS